MVIAALFHSNTNPTAAFTTLDQVNAARGARPPARGADLVLPAQHGFHLQEPVPVREHAVVEAGHGGARSGEALKKVYRDPVWRASVRKELASGARPDGVQRRMGQAVRRRDGEGGEPRAGRRDPGRARAAGRQGSARLHPRLRAVGESRHPVRGPAPAQRREGGRQDPGRPQHPHLAVAMPARISPSSATPASACT